MGRSLKRVALAASTALTLAAGLLVGTASAATADVVPDLSSRAAIEQYLVSIGVDPADAVWQTGLKNYAGPSCPGLGWNCVRANAPIVQIAAPLGTNLFSCTGLDCVAVQIALQGGQNDADCIQDDKHDPDALQDCDITQTNEGNQNSTNTAHLNMSIQQSESLEEADVFVQRARQVARITQTNSAGNNVAAIHQLIRQSQNASGGEVAQSQEAHQSGTVRQETDTGDNHSNVDQHQNQIQRASGTSVTQDQNTELGSNVNPFACDQPKGLYNQTKNQCADITQLSGAPGDPPVVEEGGGTNRSNLSHDISQRQTASDADTVTQSQGAFSSGEGGNKLQLSSGVSHGTATQDMVQVQTAPADASGSQSQETGDPRCCWIQEGNDANSANIIQTTMQSSSSNGFQHALLQADCDSSGTCHVEQSATTNNESETNECTSGSCHEIVTCFEGEGSSCTAGGD
jgi:hypothetical protein